MQIWYQLSWLSCNHYRRKISIFYSRQKWVISIAIKPYSLARQLDQNSWHSPNWVTKEFWTRFDRRWDLYWFGESCVQFKGKSWQQIFVAISAAQCWILIRDDHAFRRIATLSLSRMSELFKCGRSFYYCIYRISLSQPNFPSLAFHQLKPWDV